jgi:hypothetical protein
MGIRKQLPLADPGRLAVTAARLPHRKQFLSLLLALALALAPAPAPD